MKRDMNLIREILLKLEEHDPGQGKLIALKVEGTAQNVVDHHLFLLEDAGLILGVKGNNPGENPLHHVNPVCLTWSGHDFLEEARDEERWEKAMEKMKGLQTFTIGIAREILTGMIRAQLGQ